LGADGLLHKAFPDCATVDVTPRVVPDKQFYFFNVQQQKHHHYITLIDTSTPVVANLDTTTPEVCVGDPLYFSLDWDVTPPGIAKTVQQWTLPPKLVNESYPYSSVCMSYRLNTDLWTNNPTWGWYINKPGGRVTIWQGLRFSNGQYVTVATGGNFTVYRPSIALGALTPEQQNQYYTIGYANDMTCKLKLGVDDGSGDGTMRFTVDIWSRYNGEIGLTQLITADYSNPLYVFSDERCDRGEWYSGPNSVHGGNYSVPNGFVDCDDGPSDIWVTPNIVSLSCRDFARFQPDGGIPVTLGIVTWETVGVAETLLIPSSDWRITEDETTGPDGPDGSDEFPRWTINQGGM
jgi:hypothetical protein